MAKFDGIVEKVNADKTDHNYISLFKLYDKQSNGALMIAELEIILANLGDEIPQEDVKKMILEDCEPEDEDGFFTYMSLLFRLMGKA